MIDYVKVTRGSMCEQKGDFLPFPMYLVLSQCLKEFECMVGKYLSSMREGVKEWGGTKRDRKGKENST